MNLPYPTEFEKSWVLTWLVIAAYHAVGALL
jgi:hypothetical protein